MWLYFLIMAGVVVLDQGTKWLVLLNMDLHESVPVIPGVFNFTYVRNPGAALGILKDSRWVFIVISVIGIGLVIGYLVKERPKNKWISVPLSMIAGGGIGNMIDRLFYGVPSVPGKVVEFTFGRGEVVDFIDFCAFPNLWKWIFNVADSFVCVAAGILLVYLIMDIIKDAKGKKSGSGDGDNA